MLTKPPIVTYIPAVIGQAYAAASSVCTPKPPPPETPLPPVPPVPPPASGGVAYYVYVPANPVNPAFGETRTPMAADPGAGYTCDAFPKQYFIEDPSFPNGLTAVYERRCYWTYP